MATRSENSPCLASFRAVLWFDEVIYEKFSLSPNLASYMGNEYISNYANYNGWQLAFYGYVTAERFTGENKLLKIIEMSSKIILQILKVS